jgi:8-oxo-dGTP pyrophosphatase MutT (NUDIX family)
MKQQLLSILTKLGQMEKVNQSDVDKGLQQLAKTDSYVRDENPAEHFCVFCVPIVPSKRLIFMGNHIKAKGWIPPGGHMDSGETTMQTLKREFEEELQYKITFEVTELFDFTVTNVTNPERECKIHLDFWYLVHLASPEEFLYDVGEFTDAGWMTFEEAAEKALDKYKPTLEKLRER